AQGARQESRNRVPVRGGAALGEARVVEQGVVRGGGGGGGGEGGREGCVGKSGVGGFGWVYSEWRVRFDVECVGRVKGAESRCGRRGHLIGFLAVLASRER